jgi:Ca2+-transporting ATPase
MGRISSAITSTPNVKTPIQRKLSKLGMWLVVVAILLCALMVIIGLAWGKDANAMLGLGMV